MTTSAAAVAHPAARSIPIAAPIDAATLMHGCRRFVIVAPHPDDETLGAGGILATLARTDTPMMLVAVTDGEASHAPGDWWTPARLRASRPRESVQALQQLGWDEPVVQRLRVADGAVATRETILSNRLEELLRADDCVATAWQHDGHPDHEATARAVLAAASHVGCTSIQFPVWKRARLLAGHGVPAPRCLRRFALDPEAMRRKRAALAAYRSQLRADPASGSPPIVPLAMQRQFLHGDEVLLL